MFENGIMIILLSVCLLFSPQLGSVISCLGFAYDLFVCQENYR